MCSIIAVNMIKFRYKRKDSKEANNNNNTTTTTKKTTTEKVDTTSTAVVVAATLKKTIAINRSEPVVTRDKPEELDDCIRAVVVSSIRIINIKLWKPMQLFI